LLLSLLLDLNVDDAILPGWLFPLFPIFFFSVFNMRTLPFFSFVSRSFPFFSRPASGEQRLHPCLFPHLVLTSDRKNSTENGIALFLKGVPVSTLRPSLFKTSDLISRLLGRWHNCFSVSASFFPPFFSCCKTWRSMIKSLSPS